MRDGPSSGTFGAWLRTRRKQLDLTQAELGRRAAGYILSAAAPTAKSSELAAQILGSVEALGERSGIILSPFWRQLNQDRMAITRQHLTKGSWQNALDQDRGWSKGQALAQADEVLEWN